MTATHHCAACDRKTTHQVLSGVPGTAAGDTTVLCCVVCGVLVQVTITEEQGSDEETEEDGN